MESQAKQLFNHNFACYLFQARQIPPMIPALSPHSLFGNMRADFVKPWQSVPLNTKWLAAAKEEWVDACVTQTHIYNCVYIIMNGCTLSI